MNLLLSAVNCKSSRILLLVINMYLHGRYLGSLDFALISRNQTWNCVFVNICQYCSHILQLTRHTSYFKWKCGLHDSNLNTNWIIIQGIPKKRHEEMYQKLFKSTNALHAFKFSRVTRIQYAQRFNLKVFKSHVTSSGFFQLMKAWELAETSYHNIQVSGKKKNNTFINYLNYSKAIQKLLKSNRVSRLCQFKIKVLSNSPFLKCTLQHTCLGPILHASSCHIHVRCWLVPLSDECYLFLSFFYNLWQK